MVRLRGSDSLELRLGCECLEACGLAFTEPHTCSRYPSTCAATESTTDSINNLSIIELSVTCLPVELSLFVLLS